MNKSTTLITAVAKAFNLPNDIFTDMFLEEHIGCVRVEHQESYFKSLFGADTEYKKPLDRVADATKHYKREHKQNNYALSHELAQKITSYLLELNNTNSSDNLTLPQKVAKYGHSSHFTPVENQSIEYAGGLSSFVDDTKISINTGLLLECYNSAFFGEEPKVRVELKS